MRFKASIAIVMCLAAITAYAVDVNITGTVTSSVTGQPVPGADVSLAILNVTTQTDPLGRYAFVFTGAVNPAAAAHALPAPRFVNSKIRFTTVKDRQQVRIDLFGINGRRIRTIVNGTLKSGSHTYPLFENAGALQMYIVFFQVDGVVRQYKYINIGDRGLSAAGADKARQPVDNATGATALLKTATVDTLKAEKTGYRSSRREIASYTGVQDFTLDTACAALNIYVWEKYVDTVTHDTSYLTVAGADVMVFDAATNIAVTRASTDSAGTCVLYVQPNRQYYTKTAAQHYRSSPPPNGTPLPFTAGDTGTASYLDIFLAKDLSAVNVGMISGFVKSTLNEPITGAMVIAIRQSDSITVTGNSGPGGYYLLFNVPEGTYYMEAYLAGWYQATPVTGIGVIRDSMTSNVNIQLTANGGTSLSGRITFLASQNSEVDVTMTHIISHGAIPGLNTMTVSQNYTLDSIPPGTYVPWASYRNDGYVMDPDWIRKFGLPALTFPLGGGPQTLNFSITDAITIISPTNPPDTIAPVVILTDTPTFKWVSYPSTGEYIIAVYNSSGNVIWGGYNAQDSVLHAKINAQTDSVRFNFDGSATELIRRGFEYRWKIWADKDRSDGVQQLISSSEDLMGLFSRAGE
ncbi:MAG: carboxypeptidase regulatory-like domain-containing protein [Chitinispirillaceae bacterium]|nr:carboxypeptidase regulatory-like domain-containing protein [Chitinispirillaceae bacterium]